MLPRKAGNLKSKVDGERLGTGYMPWALNCYEQVIYAAWGEGQPSGPPDRRFHMHPYDGAVSQIRRRLAQSELGYWAAEVPAFTRDAVSQVSAGVRRYLVNHSKRQQVMDLIVHPRNGFAHYLYSDLGGYGTVGKKSEQPPSASGVFEVVLSTLSTGSVAQQLQIHDSIGRKVLNTIETENNRQRALYLKIMKKVRPDWYEDTEKRGRAVDKNYVQELTPSAGVAPDSLGPMKLSLSQPRKRATEVNRKDPGKMNDPRSREYYRDLEQRNLLFGAGPSGTTGTLLAAAGALGDLKLDADSELLRQYCMAIVGYLVGGGMHTIHESLHVASSVGLPYKPGSLIEVLPRSFRTSEQCHDWHVEYYDIVTLGAIHWLFSRQQEGNRELQVWTEDALDDNHWNWFPR